MHSELHLIREDSVDLDFLAWKVNCAVEEVILGTGGGPVDQSSINGTTIGRDGTCSNVSTALAKPLGQLPAVSCSFLQLRVNLSPMQHTYRGTNHSIPLSAIFQLSTCSGYTSPRVPSGANLFVRGYREFIGKSRQALMAICHGRDARARRPAAPSSRMRLCIFVPRPTHVLSVALFRPWTA